jgi:hypothetical protein
VIIHLAQGTYYSLNQSAAAIWQLLQQGANLAEITTQLCTLYQSSSGEITRSLPNFVSELVQEQLIVSTNPSPSTNVVVNAVTPPQEFTGHSFIIPTLQKFTDMQELLLLDPIHEVDHSGWPHRQHAR